MKRVARDHQVDEFGNSSFVEESQKIGNTIGLFDMFSIEILSKSSDLVIFMHHSPL
jgi:hypothetical protein